MWSTFSSTWLDKVYIGNPPWQQPDSAELSFLNIIIYFHLLQGEYDVQVVARSTEGEELMCVVVHFEMLVRSALAAFKNSWLYQQH